MPSVSASTPRAGAGPTKCLRPRGTSGALRGCGEVAREVYLLWLLCAALRCALLCLLLLGCQLNRNNRDVVYFIVHSQLQEVEMQSSLNLVENIVASSRPIWTGNPGGVH